MRTSTIQHALYPARTPNENPPYIDLVPTAWQLGHWRKRLQVNFVSTTAGGSFDALSNPPVYQPVAFVIYDESVETIFVRYHGPSQEIHENRMLWSLCSVLGKIFELL